MNNIADQTERAVISEIVGLYTADKVAIWNISQHIAEILTRRRTIIRDRKRKKKN